MKLFVLICLVFFALRGSAQTAPDSSVVMSFRIFYPSGAIELHEDYLRPQENGSHYGTQFVELSDGVRTIRVQNKDGFSFCASPYTPDVLDKTAHDDELPTPKSTYLYADFYMSGIGSNSCGPLPTFQYRTPHNATASMTIIFK